MGRPITIVIAEDHRILRDGLKALFSLQQGLSVVGEAEDGREALRAVRETDPDIVFLDISMPRTSGLHVIKEIKASAPRTKVLVLTVHNDEEYVLEALKQGADGYLLKHSGYEDILTAIRRVMDGKKYLSPDVSDKVVEGYIGLKKGDRETTSWDSLSTREKEVMKLIAEGYTNREIAAYLYISSKTVEKHRANLMNKLGVHSVAELTSIAVRKGLVSPV